MRDPELNGIGSVEHLQAEHVGGFININSADNEQVGRNLGGLKEHCFATFLRHTTESLHLIPLRSESLQKYRSTWLRFISSRIKNAKVWTLVGLND